MNPEGDNYKYALRFQFAATNNEAEYEALINGLDIAQRLGVNSLKAFSDSQVVVNQVLGDYVVNEPQLQRYCAKALQQLTMFDYINLKKIPREENGTTDALSKLATIGY